MANCPWSGLPCLCTVFSFKRNGLIPTACESLLPIEMTPIRSVSDARKVDYQRYLAWCKEQAALRKAGKPYETDYAKGAVTCDNQIN